MKKMIAFTMAAAMALSSLSVTAYASVFADIKSVPWPGAATFVDQAQSLGLMSGYDENGKKYAKPKNNVTYCETVQMVYSILKVQKNEDVTAAQITKWNSVLKAYNIPDWAKNAVVFALEKNLIGNTDLPKFRNGTGPATREDVGVIFGKALALFYDVNNNAKLTYKDAGNVAKASVPYLALLNEKKLMVGDDQNKFNPKAKINRAEMAVLSVKTHTNMGGGTTAPTAPSAGTTTGTVQNSMVLTNGDIFLSVKTTAGVGLNLFGKKSDVSVTFEKEKVELGDIGTGDTVKITYNGETLKTVEITKSVAGINTKKTLPITDLTASRITMKDGSKTVDYRISKDVSVTIAGKKSSLTGLRDALDDDEYSATVSFDKYDEVIKIEAVKNANNPLTGDLAYLSDTKVGIEIGSREYEYPLYDGDVTIKYGSKKVLFDTLKSDYRKNNYQVTLKLDTKGSVTDITIDYMEDETNGTLKFVNSRRIELLANGKTYTYDLDDKTDVSIDGKSKDVDDLIDVYKDDVAYTVSLDVDRDNYVKEVTATKKNAGLSEGTLDSLSSSKIKIKVDGKSYEYDVSSSTDITIDGKSVSLSTFRNGYKDYTFKVSLKFDSKNKVTDIVAKNTKATKGTLKNIEPKKDEISIICVGVTYDYDLAKDVTVKVNGGSSSVSKLDSEFDTANRYDEKINVTLTLNSDDEVTRITAETETDSEDSVSGEFKSTDGWYINIIKNGSTKEYSFASGNVTMTLDGSNIGDKALNEARADLDRDQIIQATLYLDSKDNVVKVSAKTMDEDDVDEEDKAEEGYLISVSTSSRRIKIEDNKGKEYTWYGTSGCDVNYDLSSTYDEDDYDDDLDGLKELLGDLKSSDDLYVELTVNSSGEVTRIDVEDE